MVGLSAVVARPAAAVGCALPVAADDHYTTPFGRPLTVASPGLLANDVGASLRVETSWGVSADNPDPSDDFSFYGNAHISYGNSTLSRDRNRLGGFIYTPDPDPNNPFSGNDQFDYSAIDSCGNEDFATAYVTVIPTVVDASYATAMNTTLTVGSATGFLAHDRGVDAFSLSYDATSAQGGTVADSGNSDGSFVYTPPANFSGADNFGYSVYDINDDNTYDATVHIEVLDTPPTAPRTVHASLVTGAVAVSWSAPASGAPITGYTLRASPGGKTLHVGGSQTHVTVAGLAPATYTFRVQATNVVGTGASSAPSNAVTLVPPLTYTARYTDSQYAFMIKTANHFHLAVQDVPKTGVAVVAFILKISKHPATKPIVGIQAVGNHLITTTYTPTTNANTMVPVEMYIVQTGNNTLYIGGLLMEYFAAIAGVH
jgi:hypothetical protein